MGDITFFRLCESHINRPRSAVKAAAYRAGEKLTHKDNIYDYSFRRDVIHTEILLPANAPPEFLDRQTLWVVAEKAEDTSTRRTTARTAHEILVSFPRELEIDTCITMVKELIETCFVSQGMCADFVVHRGDSKEENHIECNHEEIPLHNPHAHIMLPTRHVEGERFNKRKAREWEDWGGKSGLLTQWRKEWADIQNRMFERKGLPWRVSHLSYKKQEQERDLKNERSSGISR